MSELNKYELEDLMRKVIKSEFSELRRELGLNNEVSQAYAFRRYGEHYIKKWQTLGLKSHKIAGKRTRKYYITDIEKFAANDRLYQNKVQSRKKAESKAGVS